MSNSGKYLIVIAGPTAVGKTQLAIDLAKHFNTVIISADSRQIYHELNIGTAKPNAEQLATVPHYLVGTHSVDELYGAGHYATEVDQLLLKLFKTRTCVILTGGSGLYIDAVLNGVDEFEEVPEPIRTALNTEFAEKGMEWLRTTLQEVDPDYCKTADLQNPQRMIRALEVWRHTGKPFSSFRAGSKKTNQYTAIKLLINRNRAELYARINERVDQMMAAGLLAEVQSLFDKRQLNALRTVGYRELYEFIEGQRNLESAVDKIKQHSRNYAKRQLTWFKNKDQFVEFDASQEKQIIKYIEEHIR
jgi:tRNA dimethylallyltransferase